MYIAFQLTCELGVSCYVLKITYSIIDSRSLLSGYSKLDPSWVVPVRLAVFQLFKTI